MRRHNHFQRPIRVVFEQPGTHEFSRPAANESLVDLLDRLGPTRISGPGYQRKLRSDWDARTNAS